MSTITYKCNTCKREIRKIENLHGLTVFSKCIITDGCRGNLYKIGHDLDSIREEFPSPQIDINDYYPRKFLYIHNQPTNAYEWKVFHNLSVIPTLSVYKSVDGEMVKVDQDQYTVNIIDKDSLSIKFDTKKYGIVHCISKSSIPAVPKLLPPVEELNQVSSDGAFVFAVPEYITKTDTDYAVPFDTFYRNIKIYIRVIKPNAEPIDCFEELNGNLNATPWNGWETILVRNRRVYNTRAKRIDKFQTFFDVGDEGIPDGTLLQFLKIDYGDYAHIEEEGRDIASRGLFVLLSSAPYESVDKVRDNLIDVGELIDSDYPYFIYNKGEFYTQPTNLEITYPDIRNTDTIRGPRPLPSPTPSHTPMVTPTSTPDQTPTQTPTITPTQTVTPTVTPTLTPTITPTPSYVQTIVTCDGMYTTSTEYDVDKSWAITQDDVYPGVNSQTTPFDYGTGNWTYMCVFKPSGMVGDFGRATLFGGPTWPPTTNLELAVYLESNASGLETIRARVPENGDETSYYTDRLYFDIPGWTKDHWYCYRCGFESDISSNSDLVNLTLGEQTFGDGRAFGNDPEWGTTGQESVVGYGVSPWISELNEFGASAPTPPHEVFKGFKMQEMWDDSYSDSMSYFCNLDGVIELDNGRVPFGHVPRYFSLCGHPSDNTGYSDVDSAGYWMSAPLTRSTEMPPLSFTLPDLPPTSNQMGIYIKNTLYFTLPLLDVDELSGAPYSHNFVVDWGDGSSDTITSANQAERTHTYPSVGNYNIHIDGIMEGWNFYIVSDSYSVGMTITQWGDLGTKTWYDAFYDVSNLSITATDAPDLVGNGVTNLAYMFDYVVVWGNVPNFSAWDVSGVTEFNNMCSNSDYFNCTGMRDWNVSSGVKFNSMFDDAIIFNDDISGWNVSNGTNFGRMLASTYAFDQDLSGWTPTKVIEGGNVWDGLSTFISSSGMSTANYDLLLNAWSLLPWDNTGIDFGAGSISYTTANSQTARNVLTSAPNNWIITDGGGI
jgi:hypothetical protein